MNAETRAKDLFIAVMEAPIRSEAEAIIKAHLIAAENDKLEEAARELDLSLLANIEDAPKDWLVGFDYARDRVLSLKSKD